MSELNRYEFDTHYGTVSQSEHGPWVDAPDALAIEQECDALKAEAVEREKEFKRQADFLKWVYQAAWPFAMACWESGCDHPASGFWTIDQIFSDGGPPSDMEDIDLEFKEMFAEPEEGSKP